MANFSNIDVEKLVEEEEDLNGIYRGENTTKKMQDTEHCPWSCPAVPLNLPLFQ
jgi:hypothetical protein